MEEQNEKNNQNKMPNANAKGGNERATMYVKEKEQSIDKTQGLESILEPEIGGIAVLGN